ncbi:AP-3 complex subunit beta-2 [Anopheles cruzii]|uniref:AP-3 complex subunit beta-2 n=1 Tax=Anopheles cruzii TaxID=68878 RepID=UPI0022EC5186|nr:AP-3 complex subunit beta-2 [Anopheles cruzii]
MLSSGSAAIGVSALASTAYGNERTEVAEYANEGGFFHADYKKHDDLKQMLDSNKDSLKLEAMKRIIGMVAKGRDASDLFPAVVKNVVSKNIEVKKLVYVYLVRYAEEQQDLALLSISTFQRALKDPNQLIRASALRVLSSIRVIVIVPIVMLAIRDSASDMSPYVRKTAAHAIPKLYHLDPDQKEELMVVIEKLLADRTTLVVGSAVMAFEEVCPERTELIHKNYRKLCNLLADVDEWGQVLIINMLTRYARTQFLDPNADDQCDYEEEENKPFYEDDSNSDASEGAKKGKGASSDGSPRKTYTLDVDHRMLLRQTKPLLQSRNASVVMAVAQLYHHVAPRNEVEIVAKALIRLLRSYKEVQSVVLTCIASMSIERKSIFEPFLKSFFVRTSDQTHIKLLKLEIMTNLATATSISVILREFQTYISSNDKEFVASTIQAIGRCAVSISDVTDTCLSGLVHLLSNKDEYVVAESVVVIKKLLQTQKEEHFEIISQMAKLLDFIQVPAARASILWLIGEYNEKVPKIAPDVLRKLVKTFIDEQDIVKLQVLNLAVKLHLTNPSQTALLCQHLHNLARYDPNYDIRDRARFLKPFLVTNGQSSQSILQAAGRKIFLAEKPAPTLESKYHGRRHYQLGSLSHYLNMPTTGYQDLPAWPKEAPDSTVRHVEPPSTGGDYLSSGGRGGRAGTGNATSGAVGERRKKKSKSFYSGSEEGSSTTTEGASTPGSSSSSGSGSGSSTSSGSGSSSGSGTSSGSEGSGSGESASASEDERAEAGAARAKHSHAKTKHRSSTEPRFAQNAYNEVEGTSQSKQESSTEDSESDSSDSDESSSSGSSTSESSSAKKTPSKAPAKQQPVQKGTKSKQKSTTTAPPAKSNLDLLLDLDDIPPIGPVMTPSLGGFLTPMAAAGLVPAAGSSGPGIELVGPSFISSKKHELLNKVNGFGLGLEYRFVRSPHLYSSRMVSVELTFTNYGNVELLDIEVGNKANLPAGVAVNDFAPISQLNPGQSVVGMLGVDFNDSTQPVPFEIRSGSGTSPVTMKAPIGEMVRSVALSGATFDAERNKLRGMTEHCCTVQLPPRLSPVDKTLHRAVFEVCNVASVAVGGTNADDPACQRCLFAGQTMSSKSLVLIVLEPKGAPETAECTLTVNCEKLVVGSMLLNELKAVLKK